MNVIVIEDQILFRELIVNVLRNDFGLNILGEFEDGESGMAACIEQRPDLVVLDIKIKKLGGLTVFNRLKDRVPDLKIILVSAHFTPEIVKSTVERGVNGLVTKDSSVESLKDAIGQILKGAVYYSPEAYNLLRQPVNFSVRLADDSDRFFHGYVSRFEQRDGVFDADFDLWAKWRGEFDRAQFFRLPDIYRRIREEVSQIRTSYAGSEVDQAAGELLAELDAELQTFVQSQLGEEQARLARIAEALESSGP